MFANFWVQKNNARPPKAFFIIAGAYDVGDLGKAPAIGGAYTSIYHEHTQLGYVWTRGTYWIYGRAYGEVKYSTNGGGSWTEITGPADIQQMIYANGKYYCVSSNGLHTSTDGNTYTIDTGVGAVFCYGICVNGDKLYVACASGLYYSANDGARWTLRTTSQGLPNNAAWCCLLAGTTLWVGTTGGIGKSTDDGANFTAYTTTQGLHANRVTNMAYDPVNTRLYASNDDADTRISYTSNAGSNWAYFGQLDIELYGETTLADLQYYDGVIYAGGLGSTYALGYSTDAGANWSYVPIADTFLSGSACKVYSIWVTA